MATSLNARVLVSVTGELANSLDVGSVSYPFSFGVNQLFADGTGADQAKEVWTDTRTLTASATENLDLAGVLVDVFGTVLIFTKIKALIVKADAGNTNDVLVGGHASAAFVSMFSDATDVVRVKPGGMFAITAPDATGLAVTATTGDLLKVTNSAGTTAVTYTIVIIGTV